MARLPRLSAPGCVHHVIQRGNNGQAICVTTEDFQQLLGLVEEAARQHEVVVHAYVLLDSHFQLLLTPRAAEGLPRMMQAIGRRYVRHFNRAHGRTGTLWEGRYRSTVIEPQRYLLPCMSYMDWAPVRAGRVERARDYPWSSHGHYVGLRQDRWLTPHPLYWQLGNTPFAREAAYAALVQAGISAADQQVLTDAVLHGWALGSADFKAELQKSTGRRVSKANPGRPNAVQRPAAD